MDQQDITYLALLMFSVIFGYLYKGISNLKHRKCVGTFVGISIILIVSDVHILHNLIFFLVNAIIILKTSKRTCHLMSIVFSFAYLLFFRTTEYFGIPYPPSHTNLVLMMLTLRMTSVAFDVNQCHTNKYLEKGDNNDELKSEITYDEFSLDIVELFHYSFNYVGVMTGPFIKYRTFRDYFSKPFRNYARTKEVMCIKLKQLPMFAAFYLLATHYYPFSYAKTDEFFNDRSVLYRLWYIWPTFFSFRMRIFVGFILSECTCIMAGFGVYPEISEPISGGGPTKNFSGMEKLLENEKEMQAATFNFNAVNAVDVYGTEFAPTFKEGMRAWNTSVQYWLGLYIYKRCTYKKYRALITMFISSAWHGVYLGHYICLGCAPFVLPVDSVWYNILLKDRSGFVRYVNGWIMLIISRFFFSYLAIAFHYLTVDWVIRYYNSVYHLGIIIGVVLYYGGMVILERMHKTNKPNDEQTKKSL